MINKIIVGAFGEREDFSYEYSVFDIKTDYGYANSLLNSIK